MGVRIRPSSQNFHVPVQSELLHHLLNMSAIARLSVSPRLAMAAWRNTARPATSALIHTSSAKQDIDSAAKIIGYARNPSLKQQLFSYAILGFALSEAMGLFCLMMAFLLHKTYKEKDVSNGGVS